MNYTEKHLDQVDAELSRIGRNGDPPKLSPELSSDPEIKEAAKDVELLWQATRLERLQGKLEMLKDYAGKAKAEATLRQAQGPGAEESKESKVVRMSSVRWLLSAAAGVLLLVAVGWWMFRDQGPQEIQNEYLAMHFGEYIQFDPMKGDGTPQEVHTKDQQVAYDQFAVRNFDKAIPKLKKEWEEHGDTLSLFYLIASHFATGDADTGKSMARDLKHHLTSKQVGLLDELIKNSN